MNIKPFIQEKPTVLTIVPTHRCTASCHDCCFGCNPNIDHIMSYEDMASCVDHSIATFPSIKVLVITGGECFLLGKDLDKIIAYASRKKLTTRVVTNAYWANTYEAAYERLSQLKEAGLCEYNMSTGKNHQQFIKQSNIINAAKAAIDVNLKEVVIAQEIVPGSTKENEQWKTDPDIEKHVKTGRIKVINGPWMAFQEDSVANEPDFIAQDVSNRCENLYKLVTINPYFEVLACCGITAEYNPYLKLGNLSGRSLKDIYDGQFNDLYLLWLYTDGAKYIYTKIMGARGLEPKKFPHPCGYCVEIIRDKENINILKNLLDVSYHQ